MSTFTDPTFAFTFDLASGTTPMWDALAGCNTQHPAADHSWPVDRVRHASVIKAVTRRRLRLPRWFSRKGRHMPASTSQHPAPASVAPRITTVNPPPLYGCRKRRAYAQPGYAHLLDASITACLLESQWHEMLRCITTIELKEPTASQLLRWLNAYSTQHPLYHARQECGTMPRSDFTLRYLDDVELRQAIGNQLQQSEGTNKFSQVISFICWRYLYLSQLIASEEASERMLTAVKNGPVESGCHGNWHGNYDCSDEKRFVG